MTDYQRVARAIRFIVANQDAQPSLTEVARSAGLSPFHFQRLFSRWAGVTPKRFLQVLTVERAKDLLSENAPVFQTTCEVGLSSGSRLHEHFVQLEAVTPGEFRRRGEGLRIRHGTVPTPFGLAFVATTPRGICRFSFLGERDESEELNLLELAWPRCRLKAGPEEVTFLASKIFERRSRGEGPLSLHVAGTNFQVNVWKALLRIPFGHLTTYQRIATHLGKANGARAVGGAVGANPVAFLIPCHRVIRGDGRLGGYRWGEERKHALHAWESAEV